MGDKVPKGVLVADALLDFVNDYGVDSKNFSIAICRAHRTLQQSVMRLFITMVRSLAKVPTDDRNEAAVELAKRICEIADDYPLPFI